MFLVRLAAPAWYQPDHPKAAREVTELPVNAPTEDGARIHAYRVLTGDVQITAIERVEDKRALRPAPINDLPLPDPEAAPGSGVVGVGLSGDA